MEFGKTTIMRILQNLMNFNFAELIKYDFESIDIEVTAKSGKIIKETIKYADLLPTDEEIKKTIIESKYFYDDLYQAWDGYKRNVSDDEKISFFDDDSMSDEEKIETWDEISDMYEEFENGNIHPTIIDILNDCIKRDEIKNIMRKIIKKEEINNLYYNDYINKLKYDEENKYYCFDNICCKYDLVKTVMEHIVEIVEIFLEKELSSNKEINFNNKKIIIRMIKIIKDEIDKYVDVLDMTKVYNFGNDLLTSSLLTNKLFEWKSTLPAEYYEEKSFFYDLERDVYLMVLKELDFDKVENKSKDISELNSNKTIEINSIINHYFYDEEFVLKINKKALEYYENYNNADFFIYTEKSIEEDKNKLKDRFIKFIRPIILKNSPFDAEFYTFGNMNDKMFCDFCTKEWHLFEENINPKIKVLQNLLDEYLMNKNVEVTPMGLIIRSKDDNRKIPLNMLSSGEKKLIVIFMHCLFNEDVPIIIDEPEISLSIIWQENLLPDLLEKTDIKQVIVATHSSAVISNSILDEYIIPLPNSIVDREEDFNE